MATLTEDAASTATDFGALCRHTHAAVAGAAQGDLAGLRFVAKDVFDVAGTRTAAGSPDWLRTHEAARSTAPAVQRLLDAGASLTGRAQTDELAFSLNGQNAHYGTPVNPRAPQRIPGGSSSGSAVAVAAGLVDFSIGSDCGGSVRLPASYCGILGFRPTHGRVPVEGAVALASSFDTVGWFAREAAVLERVGRVLLADARPAAAPRRLANATDLFALAPAAVGAALQDGLRALAAAIGGATEMAVLDGIDIDGVQVFRTLQGGEAWAAHGDWIRRTNPSFGPGIRERFAYAATVTAEQVAAAKMQRERFAAHMATLLRDGLVIALPTVPGIAPLKQADAAELEQFRSRSLRLLSVAGLASLPQVNLPLGVLDGCPLGLSVIAARGMDTALLGLAGRVMA
jgi:amidase